MSIGKLRHYIDASSEYFRLAQEDEQAAGLLTAAGKYRHAVDCVLLAMEKYLRSKIYALVDPRDESFRNKHTHHSIQEAMKSFLKAASADPHVSNRAPEELKTCLAACTKLDLLQKSLGYPFYSEHSHDYWSRDVEKADAELLMHQLCLLKKILQDDERIR